MLWQRFKESISRSDRSEDVIFNALSLTNVIDLFDKERILTIPVPLVTPGCKLILLLLMLLFEHHHTAISYTLGSLWDLNLYNK